MALKGGASEQVRLAHESRSTELHDSPPERYSCAKGRRSSNHTIFADHCRFDDFTCRKSNHERDEGSGREVDSFDRVASLKQNQGLVELNRLQMGSQSCIVCLRKRRKHCVCLRHGSPQRSGGSAQFSTPQLCHSTCRWIEWSVRYLTLQGMGEACHRLPSIPLRQRSSRSPLKNGCRTLPSADFARYSISASSSGSTQMPL